MNRRIPRHDPWTGNGVAYPCDTHRGVSTVVPIEQSEALDEWAHRYDLTKRDVLAAMVEWFLNNEAELEQLLTEERERPVLV